ncbi:MAG: ATP-binding protein [Candidatus Nomurabacteria bacterium]|jgi:predicted AAA+ superfamily ATPase|nr:ATP-binding protein [Candidatus Nomurabacteria bacterium]
MIERQVTPYLTKLLKKYPIVSVTGPRQSGKSTLLTNVLKNYAYVSLENPDMRRFAIDDPRGFLERYNDKIIIDEVQYAPDLFSYIQTATDFTGKTGQYVLSGSQNFLLLKSIKQSLAGRVSIFRLLPFSYSELAKNHIDLSTNKLMLQGGYPRIYDKNIPPQEFYENYLQTYIDRDVDSLLSVKEISNFNKFLKLCATRIGQVLDVTSLASDCGIDRKTAVSWLSVLESSYIVLQLMPYYANIGKRLIKSPKLYFYDTGLASYLLGIKSEKALQDDSMRGALFENLVITEMMKNYLNQKTMPDLYFWRDSNKNEVDIIDDTDSELKMFEIKSGKTAKPEFQTTLREVANILKVKNHHRAVVYDGQTLKSPKMSFVNWRELASYTLCMFDTHSG